MKSKVYDKAFDFALKVIDVHKTLVNNKEFILSKQLLRSGTSIGANITEANGGISKADFSAKISIAYKESLETKYWIELLYRSGYLNESSFNPLYTDCDEICKMLFSILKSTNRIKIIANS